MTENDQQPFSEEAALRELEELQQKIEATRVRRKEANEAFERFLRSFERHPAPAVKQPRIEASTVPPVPPAPVAAVSPPPVPPVSPVLPPGPVVREIQPPAPVPTARELPPVESTPPRAQVQEKREPEVLAVPPPPVFPLELPPAGPPDALDLDEWDRTSASAVGAFPEESRMGAPGTPDDFGIESRSIPAALMTTGRSVKRIPLVAGVAAIVVIVAVAFFALRGNGDDAARADPVATETPAATPQPASQPAPPPVPTPPPPRAEISTLRQVWIRVMVDGQKVIERELPPNTRIPLDPASQFVVRAGDAGAVRVAIGGKDQGPVGADGRVATKAFTVPPKAVQ